MAQRTVTVDMTDVKLLRAKLGELREKAVPFGVRQALNTTAFEARRHWADRIARTMTLRNKFTVNSLRVVKVGAGSDVSTMQSQVGSVADYMDEQESGGTSRGKGHIGKAIPTTTAAGMAMRAPTRVKEVRKANYKAALQVEKRISYGVRQYRNAVAIQTAAKQGGGVVYLDLGRRKGLFRVTGTKKGNLRVRMLYDLSRKSVVIKARPTLEPTVDLMLYKAPRIFEIELQKQVDRCLEKLKK